MNFDEVVSCLSKLLSAKRPPSFSSSWILENAPECYRFIQKNVRTELGFIDWDKVTGALEPKYQRLWRPKRIPNRHPRSVPQFGYVLKKYRKYFYVFISPGDKEGERLRDQISIIFVRSAQVGYTWAKRQLLHLLEYVVEEWIAQSPLLARWLTYRDELRALLEGCVRRYRYTGSFLRYVYRTLELAARGLRPLLVERSFDQLRL